jgi:hypothetical protein
MTGIEPVNLFLTKEALYRLSYMGLKRQFKVTFLLNLNSHYQWRLNIRSGAGDEIRTRDIQLGRLKLYQLSYSRILKKLK